ncbi:MAG: phosphomannomutase/phosphoglucomutase [Deltaproteobacteria bacterium]
MQINQGIFRGYDIRGIAGEELTQSIAEAIGKAFGTITKRSGASNAVVGYDNRISSYPLKKALIKGITAAGVNVIDCGTIITPALYYARIYYGTNAGVMVTASHNPPQYNGFKLCSAKGDMIYGEQLQQLRRMIEEEDFECGEGKIQEGEIRQHYLDMIASKIRLGDKRLKVVVDCGNGTASYFAKDLIEKMGCEVIPIFCESDPAFPNHFPDPTRKENLAQLIETVIQNKASLGIAYDGDGDRLGVVDDKGNIIWGDLLMILFWREIMPRHPGAKAIVEVKCSQALIDEIEKLGGEPIFFKTGHSLIKARMKELKAVFTGEMSGHMFFADEYYGYDDAVYAAMRLLRILSHAYRQLSELLSDINKYYSTPELRISSNDIEKFKQVEKARAYFKQKGISMIEVDGVRALFDFGWGLVRASNTSPEIIVRCEAKNPDALEIIKQEVKNALGITNLE